MAISVNQQGLSFIQYLTDGVAANFPFIFTYIKAADIVVYVNSTAVTYTFLNASTVTPTVLPPAGAIVTIRRFTESDARIVDFQDGAQLSEAVLDQDSNQMFFLAQETMDISNFGLGVDPLLFTMDARGYRIINVGDAVLVTDGTNKGQLDAVEAAAIAAGAAAQATANAAVITADAATITANAASVTANAISGTANTALVNANAAVITADAAAVTANAISATATTALANAATAQGTANTALANAATAQATADAAIPTTEKAAALGVATLDAGGKIPSGQLPDFVDDVLEYANFAALPVTGVSGIIYITLNDNKTFRWDGLAYVLIGGGGISTWETAKIYAVSDVVIANDKIYSCLITHTSGTFSTDLIAGDWKEISAPSSAGVATYMLANAVSDIGGYYQAVALNTYTAAAALVLPTAASVTPALMGSFASNIGYPNITVIPVGLFNVHYETQKTAGSINYYTYFELYKRSAGGVETLLGTSDLSTQTAVNTLVSNDITIPVTSPITFLSTDRGVIKIYVVTLSSTATVSLRVDDGTSSRIELPAATVDATNFVPYTGATSALNMGIHNISTTGTVTASNVSGTNTGDLITQGQSEGSSTVVSKLLAQFSQLTTTASGERLFEGGDGNQLVNPSFAGLNTAGVGSGWTNASTNSVATITTTSGEFSTGVQAQKIALTAGVLNLYQSVASAVGAIKQHVIGVSYRVPSTMADFQICTLIAGAEKTCVPSANLILDDAYHTIEIPEVITPGSTVGIKFKTTSSYTANAYFDKAIIKAGIGTQNLALDNVYSAKVSGAGTVTDESKDFISGCTNANPRVCTFTTGIFTVAPNCTVTATGGNGRISSLSATTTATTLSIATALDDGSSQQYPTEVHCQKSGNDYLAASASVYSQSSANTDWAACTFSTLAWQGLGTVTNNLSCRRNNGFVEFKGNVVLDTVTASEIQIPLPSNYGTLTTLATSVDESYGIFYRSSAASSNTFNAISTNALGYFKMSAPIADGAASPMTAVGGTTNFSNGNTVTFSNIKIPIAGWSNSSSITGTFAGTPKVPGLDSNVDTFSVSYGESNLATACATSPCYIDQFGQAGSKGTQSGGAVVSITRTGACSLLLTTKKTYTKLKCTSDLFIPGVGSATIYSTTDGMSCANCSSIAFQTQNAASAGCADAAGTIMCQGSY